VRALVTDRWILIWIRANLCETCTKRRRRKVEAVKIFQAWCGCRTGFVLGFARGRRQAAARLESLNGPLKDPNLNFASTTHLSTSARNNSSASHHEEANGYREGNTKPTHEGIPAYGWHHLLETLVERQQTNRGALVVPLQTTSGLLSKHIYGCLII